MELRKKIKKAKELVRQADLTVKTPPYDPQRAIRMSSGYFLITKATSKSAVSAPHAEQSIQLTFKSTFSSIKK